MVLFGFTHETVPGYNKKCCIAPPKRTFALFDQKKMAIRMTIQEQALLSGLVFADSKDKLDPQWRPSGTHWPPLLERHVSDHGLVVVHYPHTNHDNFVVLLGGGGGGVDGTSFLWHNKLGKSTELWRETVGK